MGIPFIYTPYVHWKTEAYQNVTPEESDRQIDSQRFHLKLHVKEGNIKKLFHVLYTSVLISPSLFLQLILKIHSICVNGFCLKISSLPIDRAMIPSYSELD